jgi:putative ABC transport system permease protein
VSFGRDVAFAARSLARNPGFTLIAAAALALGIGSNTAIFSIVDGVLLRPLPFHAPEQLFLVSQRSVTVPRLGISELDCEDYRARNHVFEGLSGYTEPAIRTSILTGAGDPLQLAPSYVTANYFSLLGVSPAIGRNFLPEEDRRGRNNFAILSYSLWQSRFGGSQDVLRQQVTIDNQKLNVVGVMGAEAYPTDADVYLPFTRLDPDRPRPRNYHALMVVGRTRPGQNPETAQTEMESISHALELENPATNAGISSRLTPLREEIIGSVQEPIVILSVAVGLVLLIACGNVANLQLVRAAARQKEIAIRAALGASRAQILRQFLIESAMLATIGAAAGILLAAWSLPLLRRLGEGRIPRLQHVGIDTRVLLFTTGLTLVTALLSGLLPALKYSSANLNRSLRAGGRSSVSDSGRMRSLLVIVEVALALIVVVGASLLVRSFNEVTKVYPGFRTDHLLVGQISLPSAQYKRADIFTFYGRLLPRLRATPGVVSVSTTTALPLASTPTQSRFMIQGMPAPEPGRYPVTTIASVGVDYFQAMGIPILRGRTFLPEEMGMLDDRRCIVNATLAGRFFHGQDPIGKVILTNVAAPVPDPCHVIAVVGDTRVAGLDAPPQPVLYASSYIARQYLVMRTAIEPSALADTVERQIASLTAELPMQKIRPMDEILARSVSRRRFSATLLTIFSATGLLLAALGLYGLVSYAVAQRRQEFGVRMALGAQRGDIFAMVLWEGLLVTGVGLLLGMAGAAGATWLMKNLLFGVSNADPLSYGAGCLVLLTIASLACFVPAHRAMKVDPMVALRYE